MALQKLPYDLLGWAFPALTKTWLLQRNYHWQLMMPHNINGVLGHLISPLCQDVRFGDYSLSQLSDIQSGAFQRFYAGAQKIHGVQLSFLMSIDNAIWDFFWGWKCLAVDEEGYYHPKNAYKKNIYVSLYDRTGVESVRFTLKGAFPTTVPKFDVSYGSNDVTKLSVELSVDFVESRSIIGMVRGAITNAVTGAVSSVVGKSASGFLGI